MRNYYLTYLHDIFFENILVQQMINCILCAIGVCHFDTDKKDTCH